MGVVNLPPAAIAAILGYAIGFIVFLPCVMLASQRQRAQGAFIAMFWPLTAVILSFVGWMRFCGLVVAFLGLSEDEPAASDNVHELRDHLIQMDEQGMFEDEE